MTPRARSLLAIENAVVGIYVEKLAFARDQPSRLEVYCNSRVPSDCSPRLRARKHAKTMISLIFLDAQEPRTLNLETKDIQASCKVGRSLLLVCSLSINGVFHH